LTRSSNNGTRYIVGNEELECDWVVGWVVSSLTLTLLVLWRLQQLLLLLILMLVLILVLLLHVVVVVVVLLLGLLYGWWWNPVTTKIRRMVLLGTGESRIDTGPVLHLRPRGIALSKVVSFQIIPPLISSI
jgi:hypothetical protein